MLRRFEPRSHPDLAVGTEWGDDAAVWRRPDGRALVATVDFFTPLVDDAATWGAVAAANSASDVYAMGARPLFALNIVGWPADRLPMELLTDVLEGARRVCDEGGWLVVGGHTVQGPEPLYGQAVVGEVEADRLLTNAAAQAGQALVLTKAIGTGLLATAVKRSEPSAVSPGGELAEPYAAAVASMVRLNAEASRVALANGARAATDVTGFGLLGHLHKLALASGLAAALDVAAVPRLPGAERLLAGGFVPGGTGRNLTFVRGFVDERRAGPGAGTVGPPLELLADPQTSGGLLFACPPERADEAVAELQGSGHAAARIGELTAGPAGRIHLR